VKLEASRFSEIIVTIYWVTWNLIPDEYSLETFTALPHTGLLGQPFYLEDWILAYLIEIGGNEHVKKIANWYLYWLFQDSRNYT
jgi:hypothetical protein